MPNGQFGLGCAGNQWQDSLFCICSHPACSFTTETISVTLFRDVGAFNLMKSP